MRYLAEKTVALIESVIKEDQGSSYRDYLGKVIPHIGDAYEADSFPFRSHMGASLIGRECPREIWYSFRWATDKKHKGQLLRLFNRGHLEEARFIAILLAIGVEVYQQDENGKQFRVSDVDGHFGGSGDGRLVGVPDLPEGTHALGEFKTANDSSFKKIKANGVREEKNEHYVQMNIYMGRMGLPAALYLVVNKNDDEIYGEIVPYNKLIDDEYTNRAHHLVYTETPPAKINESVGFWKCRFCDHKPVCHMKAVPDVNCRTCSLSKLLKDGQWACGRTGEILDKQAQYNACEDHTRLI